MFDFEMARNRMVDNQLRTNEVFDSRILSAMGKVPREVFLPASKRATAYIDENIVVKDGSAEQKSRYMLKPTVIARLLEIAEPQSTDLALIVASTEGYAATVIAEIVESVVGVEEDEELVSDSMNVISELGTDNLAIVAGEMVTGMEQEGPYDLIFVNGATEKVPKQLFNQLKDGGRLVVVIGSGLAAQATLYKKSGNSVSGIPKFNASIPLLPGFELTKEFEF